MVSGYVLLVCIVLLLIKFIARKSGLKKINHYLAKIHKPVGILAAVIIIFHFICTISVWETRAAIVSISGILTAVFIIMMIIMYFLRKRYLKYWMKLHRVGALMILFLLAVHMITYFQDFNSYQNKMKSTVIAGMNALGKADGEYVGSYDTGYIKAKVTVKVKDEKIESILLNEHHNERGKRAESLIPKIVKSQRTNVDTVTGATNSSKVIEKAVENALSK